MKKLMIISIIITILVIAAYIAVKSEGPLRDKFLSDLQQLKGLDKSGRFHSYIDQIENNLQKKLSFGRGPTDQKASKKQTSGEMVALYCKDGSVMVGELISKTEDEYIIDWKGQETVVFAGQVDRIGSPKEALKKKNLVSDKEISEWWPYDNDIVVRLTNRAVLDAKIKHVGKDKITLLYIVEGGGYLEQDIERSRVEYLLFRPIKNEESRKIEAELEQLFPDMEFYRVGNFTVITDSDIIWTKEFIAVLRNAYTNIYFKFFDLFKDRKPQVQNFVVIFDDFADYIEYAITDGVPGWAAPGYFSPDDKVLYLFNILGERIAKILFEGMVGESGRTIDDIVERVEGRVDKRYHIFIKGQAKVIRDKFWEAYNYYKGMFRRDTLAVLRHEFAHEIFSSWGLQNIILTRTKKSKEGLIEKKKEFLETEDCKKKAELIKALMAMRSKEEQLDMRAANSWLAEGIATYCETNPIGSRNDRRLFTYQEMVRKQAVYPVESLTIYKMGSFPGVCSEAMLYLYAQSWAFVTFLMEEYPKEFMDYQSKMAEKTAEEHEDITWLLKCLDRDLRTIDREFAEYMEKFEKLEDPFVRHFEKLYNMFRYYY